MSMTFCPLCSGSSGNSSYLEAGGLRLLIDAGVTGKRMTELLHEIDRVDQALVAAVGRCHSRFTFVIRGGAAFPLVGRALIRGGTKTPRLTSRKARASFSTGKVARAGQTGEKNPLAPNRC